MIKFDRRWFLTASAAGLVLPTASCARVQPSSKESPMSDIKPVPLGESDVDWDAMTEREWRERLTDAEFRVMRKEGTERSGSSPLNDEKRKGVFVCRGCYLPIFPSEYKYNSGTGWPSFFDYNEGTLGFKTDYKLIYPRKEYHCIRCGSHQGHVFKDGPEPTGLRYCNNGVALAFVPDEA
ncbi:peptide-methionine (R)-S-oxide reductase MsrB [Parvularcula lutaonensis]|uniref:peptide-methionine (R)-S-oxide reductase n=1 Tax=Parvularcula lutaonensis TaxID=491923 RepID=A0ABV7MB66_9PROT|nr:peptide-methionine (R)-S-oxide reductase MsrB [Parvularcula lutaonensis]